MSKGKKRIGFILASIHTGSALDLWTSIAADAERSGIPFFIFPGGRLDSRPDSEYLRNSVYRLANGENLDGLISWGSSLGGAVSMAELDNFHASLEGLPYVTIAHKMSGHPCVRFDAYTGMKSLVTHSITVHGAQKIAFIRGPETHASSEDRYRAYLDALSEAGLDTGENQRLVTDPFPWSEGEAATVQLYETRRLVPGQDFDTLIGSSDMMAFSAARYLQRFGYFVPRDYHIGGFNNSVESRILPSPFSTVRMPYEELGVSAFRMIRSLIADAKYSLVRAGIEDLVLPSEVVIRESCGCRGVRLPAPFAGNDGSTERNEKTESLYRSLSSLFKLDDTSRNAFIEPVVGALQDGDIALFFNLFERALERFFEKNRDIGLLFEAIEIVKISGCLGSTFPAGFESAVFRSIAQVQNRVYALSHYETRKLYTVLNSLKCDLLCARDRNDLMTIFSRRLKEIGIHTASVVLYEKNDFSRFIGGFFPSGESLGESELFPSRYLLPPHLESMCESAVYLVQPLFMENQSLGHFVCNVPFFDGPIFEELRSAISSALKGIFLFEESISARRDAERAERAKTEFFANVGNDLCEPLVEIQKCLQSLEKAREGEPDIAAREISWAQALVSAQIQKTNLLIDLTLSELNEIVFEKKLFHIDMLFPALTGHPLLLGDESRLGQAFSLVGTDPSAKDCGEGLLLTFTASAPISNDFWRANEMQLAEKIILLHYGEFRKSVDGCTILLPWPNLAGLPPLQSSSPVSHILALSEGLSLEAYCLSVYTLSEGESAANFPEHDGSPLLAWNGDGAPLSSWLRVYALRHHPKLFRAPFLCYTASLAGESLISGIENTVRENKGGPILFIGCGESHYEKWASPDNSVHIPSVADFSVTVPEIVPSIVVFDSVDVDAIARVRANPHTVLVPVFVLPEHVTSAEDVAFLCSIPHVILCNAEIASSAEFAFRARAILAGEEILPPHTGALVKKAILYFNEHAPSQIARWKLADSVNVSEDYLTRIFHREIGLSLWEYLNRYRIFLATGFLLRTNDSIYEIAQRTGFQDQAYFCRVFKKLRGVPPGKIRNPQPQERKSE